MTTVLGQGPLAAAIARHDCLPASDVVVACDLDTDPLASHNDNAYRAGPPLIPVRTTWRAVLVGPIVLPGQPGCLNCARAREHAARHRPETRRRMAQRADEMRPVMPVPATVADAVAGLVGDEIARLGVPAAPRTVRTLLSVDPVSLRITAHRFLPDSRCVVCGSLPADCAERAPLTLRSRPKPRSDSYRMRSLVADHETLVSTLVDEHAGVLHPIQVVARDVPLVAVAPVATTGHDVEGYGIAVQRRAAVVTAIAEALERAAGLRPGGKRTVVRGSYQELAERALDPRLLGLPRNPSPHGQPAIEGYRPDLVMPWVWAHSFARNGPVLVPQSYAYYGATEAPRLAYETSNGCALGSSLEEAILYGLLEVIERDAFLVTWYAQLPVPRLDPYSVHDWQTRLIISHIERRTGCRVHAFDVTMPEGVPTVWVMRVDEDGRPGVARTLCAARAHPDPEQALRGALMEISAGDPHLDEDTWRTARELLADPDRVVSMEHHQLLYCLPETWPRLGFLYQDTAVRSFDEAYPPIRRIAPAADLTQDLHQVMDRVRGHGWDVIVVDQTTPEARAVGLHCVKVIVPGMLPMTFGHRNRRAEGFPRLRTAPVQLGHRTVPLSDADINPHPHPFP